MSPLCDARPKAVTSDLVASSASECGVYLRPAVSLAFEEMRTPYASGWGICVQKFGNTCQRKEVGKWITLLKSTFTTGFIKRFGKIKCSQTMRAFFLKYSSVLRPSSVFLRTRIASMILCTARFVCVVYIEICVKATPVMRAAIDPNKYGIALAGFRPKFGGPAGTPGRSCWNQVQMDEKQDSIHVARLAGGFTTLEESGETEQHYTKEGKHDPTKKLMQCLGMGFCSQNL